MRKKHFNWQLAILIFTTATLVVVTVVTLRNWQINRTRNNSLSAAIRAYENKNWDIAAENFRLYLNINPTDIEILLKYANSELNKRPLNSNNIKKATDTYRNILRIDKTNQKAANTLVELLIQLNVPAEAQLIAERHLKHSYNPITSNLLAISLANQNMFDRACDQLQNTVQNHPKHTKSYENLAKIIEKSPQNSQETPQNAHETPQYWLNLAVKNNPHSAKALIARASFYLRNNNSIHAVDDITRAEKLDLSDPNTRILLATAATKASLFEKAKYHLKQIDKNESTKLHVWLTRAFIASMTNSKTEMAATAIEGLKDLDSEKWDFLPKATELFIQAGDYNNAQECIVNLKEKGISQDLVTFLQARLAEEQKQYNKAVKHWIKLKHNGVDSPKVLMAMANSYYNAGDTQSATAQLQNLISKYPNSIQVHVKLAKMLKESSDYELALYHIQTAMQLTPENNNASMLSNLIEITALRDGQFDVNSVKQKLAESKINSREKLLLRLQIALHLKQFDSAENLINELKDFEKSIETETAKIDLLLATNKTDSALAQIRKISRDFPLETKHIRHFSVIIESLINAEKAEELMSEAVRETSDPIAKRELTLLLAEFYEKRNQSDKAFMLLEQTSKQIPHDIPIKRKLIKTKSSSKTSQYIQLLIDEIKSIEGEYGWQWRYEQSSHWFKSDNFDHYFPRIVTMLKKNLLENPRDLHSSLLLAQTFQKANKTQLAIATYQDTLNKSPENIDVIIPALGAILNANEFEKADKILNRLNAKLLEHPVLSQLKLQSCIRKKQFNPAEKILLKLIQSDPKNIALNLDLASVYLKQNKYEKADKIIEMLRSKHPESLEVIASLVELKLVLDQNQMAVDLCNKAVKEHKNAAAYVLRGNTYAALGMMDYANDDFEQALKLQQDDPMILTAISRFYQRNNNNDKAVQNILKAIEYDPNNIGIKKLTIQILLSSCDSSDQTYGVQLLDEMIADNQYDVELMLLKARLLLYKDNRGALDQAIVTLQNCTKQMPNNIEPWELLVETQLKQKQIGMAMETVLHGLSYLPNHHKLLLLKAAIEAESSPELAIPTLKSLDRRESRDIDFDMQLARLYINTKNYEKAISLLQKNLSSSDASEQIQLNIELATALYKSGDKGQARELLQNLIKDPSTCDKALVTMIRLLSDDNDFSAIEKTIQTLLKQDSTDTDTFIKVAAELAGDEKQKTNNIAKKLLQNILKQNPRTVKAMILTAMIAQAAGDIEESEKLYRKILEIEPETPIALNNLAWIVSQVHEQHEEALELAQRGLAYAPEYADLIDTRGLIYHSLGNYDLAIDDFENSIELYSLNSDSLAVSNLHLAMALYDADQPDKSLQILKQTLDLNEKKQSLTSKQIVQARSLMSELLDKEKDGRSTN